jgi:hypothetical protein
VASRFWWKADSCRGHPVRNRLLLTAALALRYGLFTPEGEDPIWPYGPMWPSSLIGIAVFGLGLTWLGWQLRSEHPVGTNQGMAPAT